jgi:hypothetical protein
MEEHYDIQMKWPILTKAVAAGIALSLRSRCFVHEKQEDFICCLALAIAVPDPD